MYAFERGSQRLWRSNTSRPGDVSDSYSWCYLYEHGDRCEPEGESEIELDGCEPTSAAAAADRGTGRPVDNDGSAEKGAGSQRKSPERTDSTHEDKYNRLEAERTSKFFKGPSIKAPLRKEVVELFEKLGNRSDRSESGVKVKGNRRTKISDPGVSRLPRPQRGTRNSSSTKSDADSHSSGSMKKWIVTPRTSKRAYESDGNEYKPVSSAVKSITKTETGNSNISPPDSRSYGVRTRPNTTPVKNSGSRITKSQDPTGGSVGQQGPVGLTGLRSEKRSECLGIPANRQFVTSSTDPLSTGSGSASIPPGRREDQPHLAATTLPSTEARVLPSGDSTPSATRPEPSHSSSPRRASNSSHSGSRAVAANSPSRTARGSAARSTERPASDAADSWWVPLAGREPRSLIGTGQRRTEQVAGRPSADRTATMGALGGGRRRLPLAGGQRTPPRATAASTPRAGHRGQRQPPVIGESGSAPKQQAPSPQQRQLMARRHMSHDSLIQASPPTAEERSQYKAASGSSRQEDSSSIGRTAEKRATLSARSTQRKQEVLRRTPLTARERTLVQRASQLSSQLGQLELRCRQLQRDNDRLRAFIETEHEGPPSVRAKVVQTSREALLLKKKNQQLASATRKLEQKVEELEKGSSERLNSGHARSRSSAPSPMSRMSAPSPVTSRTVASSPMTSRLPRRIPTSLPRRVCPSPSAATTATAAESAGEPATGQKQSVTRHESTPTGPQPEDDSLPHSLPTGAGDEIADELREEETVPVAEPVTEPVTEPCGPTGGNSVQASDVTVSRHPPLSEDYGPLHHQETEPSEIADDRPGTPTEAGQQGSCAGTKPVSSEKTSIRNDRLRRSPARVDQTAVECASRDRKCNSPEAEHVTAEMEVEHHRGKTASLEIVLKQMRDVCERKKELERQLQDVQGQLKRREADMHFTERGAQPSDTDRQAAADALQALKSTLRELEKKAEVQSLRHEELMLEMSAIKKQGGKTRHWIDASPEGTVTPDSFLLFNGSTGRSSPLGNAVTPVSLEGPAEQPTAAEWTTTRQSDIQLPVTSTNQRSPACSAASNIDLDGIMAKIENDNKILAELDKNRSNIGFSGSTAITSTSKLDSTFPSSYSTSLRTSNVETKPVSRVGALSQPGHATASHQSSMFSHSGLTNQSGLMAHSGLMNQTGLMSHTGLLGQSGAHSQSAVLGGASALGAQSGAHSQPGVFGQSSLLSQPSALGGVGAGVPHPHHTDAAALLGGLSAQPQQPALLRTRISQQPTLLTAHISRPLTSAASAASVSAAAAAAAGAGAFTDRTTLQTPGAVNGAPLGLLGSNVAHLAASLANVAHLGVSAASAALQPAPLPTAIIDVLEVPGKGKCQVHVARFSYDPFHHSPNAVPESELRLKAGDAVLVWGEMDEDGFLDGETLDGRRGLVPSNYVKKLVGADLLAFHRRLTEQLAGRSAADVVSGGKRAAAAALREERGREEAALRHRLAQRRQSDHGRRSARTVPELRRAQSFRFERSSDTSAADDPRVASSPHVGFDLDLDPGRLSDEAERDFRVDPTLPAVPAPRQLTLERQLHKSVLLGWTAPDPSAGDEIECYHVFVDGLLRCTVSATEQCRALLESVDLTRRHRLTVRAVTPDGRTSAAAACTLVIGRDVAPAPTAVRASHVTATSAIIGWLPSNSNCHHTVCVNRVEVRTVAPGVHRHTITGLSPNTVYRVTVKVKNMVPHHLSNGDINYRQRLETHIEFRTLAKGVPEPPVGVQCELGPQEGCVLVTWLPVTISTSAGTSNGLPVTGYAVYADGQKVTELNSPTGDHAVIDLKNIRGFAPRQVTVRTKSRDLISADSLPCLIPQAANGKVTAGGLQRARSLDHSGPVSSMTSTQTPGQQSRQPQQRVLATEDDFSDREAEFDKMAAYKGYTDDFSGRHGSFNGHSGRDHYDIHAPWTDERRAASASRTTPHQRLSSHQRADSNPDTAYGRHGRLRANGPAGVHGSQPVSRDDQRMRVFVALFDYDPVNMSPNVDCHHDELAFREGQLIKVYGEKDGDGFYWGEASGRVGYVPCNMITEVQLGDDRTGASHYLTRDDTGHSSGYRQSSSRAPRVPPRQYDDRREQDRNWDDRREQTRSWNERRNPGRSYDDRRDQDRHWDDRRETDRGWDERRDQARNWDDRRSHGGRNYDDRRDGGRHWDERRDERRDAGRHGDTGRHGDDRRDAGYSRHWDDGRQGSDPRHWDGQQSGASGRQQRHWTDGGQPTGPVRRMVALYDYDPHHLSPNVDAEMELSFCTGDIITVYGDMDDDGFYIGEIGGTRGLVPSNFLAEAPQGQGQDRRGASAGTSPGPGQLGPPLPPRHRGDSRDRRKDESGGGGRAGSEGRQPRDRQRW